ncbi:MAG: hypothetical protein LBQ96_00100 [Fusobacteriaceae bacterium]|jgi:ABC-type branched-subunit amino acid transport system permease subunit|nr:hypothetical protein [Fusobacteriaceae bacterium]
MKKRDWFVFVATYAVFGVGLALSYFTALLPENYGIYYVGGAFSILMLVSALAEEGFNPGNYLFYCIMVLVGAIVIDAVIQNLASRGAGPALVILALAILLAPLALVSRYFYRSSMEKGLQEEEQGREGK